MSASTCIGSFVAGLLVLLHRLFLQNKQFYIFSRFPTLTLWSLMAACFISCSSSCLTRSNIVKWKHLKSLSKSSNLCWCFWQPFDPWETAFILSPFCISCCLTWWSRHWLHLIAGIFQRCPNALLSLLKAGKRSCLCGTITSLQRENRDKRFISTSRWMPYVMLFPYFDFLYLFPSSGTLCTYKGIFL